MEEVWKDISNSSTLSTLPDTPLHFHRHPAAPAATATTTTTSSSSRSAILQDFLFTDHNTTAAAAAAASAVPSLSPPSPLNLATTALSLNSASDYSCPNPNPFADVIGGGPATTTNPPSSSSYSSSSTLTHLSSSGLNDNTNYKKRYFFGGESMSPPPQPGPGSGPVDRRHKRMIMNRESAARSRARRQAYINELELEVAHLTEENARLKKQQAHLHHRRDQPQRQAFQPCSYATTTTAAADHYISRQLRSKKKRHHSSRQRSSTAPF